MGQVKSLHVLIASDLEKEKTLAEMAKWLDHLTVFQKVIESKPSSDLSQSVGKEFASSLISG